MNISLKTIDALLQTSDIEGLIEAGAPTDEYSSEATALLQALTESELKNNELTKENIGLIISKIWEKSFGLDADNLELRMPQIKILAENLFQTFKS